MLRPADRRPASPRSPRPASSRRRASRRCRARASAHGPAGDDHGRIRMTPTSPRDSRGREERRHSSSDHRPDRTAAPRIARSPPARASAPAGREREERETALHRELRSPDALQHADQGVLHLRESALEPSIDRGAQKPHLRQSPIITEALEDRHGLLDQGDDVRRRSHACEQRRRRLFDAGAQLEPPVPGRMCQIVGCGENRFRPWRVPHTAQRTPRARRGARSGSRSAPAGVPSPGQGGPRRPGSRPFASPACRPRRAEGLLEGQLVVDLTQRLAVEIRLFEVMADDLAGAPARAGPSQRASRSCMSARRAFGTDACAASRI